MEQLAKRWKKEVEDKAKVEHATKKQAEEEEEERDSDRSQKSPSSQSEGEDQCLEQGGANLETTPFQVKRTREQEKVGSRKKCQARKSSLDPVTLIEGDLNDIGDMVRDATVELLQQFEQQQKKALVAIQMGLHELKI